MPLSAGTKLGSYEILAPIGRGGMGEVYRARDTKLKRDVAIKVLPDTFARDADRMARFQREAEMLAALNHPNIATIYGVEEHALVMEMVEGESPKGPLSFDDAWKIASQIAAALEYAHDRGIIHRDLKPANIKITPEGVVKLLDFGLAKAFTAQRDAVGGAPALSPSDSPTLTIGATEVGVVLGTAAYMAPEQARGKPVDKRADIWAFGVVLYELLTGERLFQGEDAAETLAAVIHKQPDLSRVPAQARRLIESCLEKDPKQRLRDMGDARRLVGEEVVAAASLPSRLGKITAAAFVLGFAVTGVGWYRATRPIEQPLKPLVRLDVDLGSDVLLNVERGTAAVFSPDGNRLVYLSRQRLFTRRLDQPNATELPGTEGAFGSPFFSPDGQWVAFFVSGKLKKISVEGGAPITLCDGGVLSGGGSWGENGNIIVALGNRFLSRVPSAGGTPTPVTELAPGEIQRWPQILPGGRTVLFTANRGGNNWDGASIEVVSLTDRRRKALQQGTYGRYIPSPNGGLGHLVYVNRGTLFAVPFDPEDLAVRGTPLPILEQVSYSSGFGFAQLDFSRQGILIYRDGREGNLLTIQWLDGAGKTQPLLAKPDAYQSARLSPDGQRVAIATTDLWVYEWQQDRMTRLTFGGSLGSNSVPAVWSPDGRYVIFRKQGEGLFWMRSDGAGQPQLLVKGTSGVMPHSFTPDGKRLAFREIGAGTGTDLWTMPVENDSTGGLRGGKPEMFLGTQFNEDNPAFSRDGRWLAYTSNEGGTPQIFVRAFPDRGGKWQISDSGGRYPEWSRNGRELFFRNDDGQIAVAAYTVKGDSFVADKPRIWSEKRLANAFNGGSNYNLAPDGKRAVVFAPVGVPAAQQAQNHVIFLENFFDELRRKVPVGRSPY